VRPKKYMKNICITKSRNKFNNNIIYYNQEANFIDIDFPTISIYKHWYLYQQSINSYIINSSVISEEIITFIQEFNSNIEFIVYFDIFSDNLYQLLQPIVKKTIVNHDINKENSIKLPKNIINDILYTNLQIPSKKNQLIYFIDNNTDLPLGLQSALYPNTNNKIKMFNSQTVQHPQNLGFVSEEDKKNILLESSTYCYSNPEYLAEAMLCGCKALDVEDTFDLEKCYSLELEYTTYGSFLRDNIL
jgi:hypothetical protein